MSLETFCEKAIVIQKRIKLVHNHHEVQWGNQDK